MRSSLRRLVLWLAPSAALIALTACTVQVSQFQRLQAQVYATHLQSQRMAASHRTNASMYASLRRDRATDELQSERDAARAELSQANASISDLKQQVDQLQKQVSALQAATVGLGSGPPSAVTAVAAAPGANRFAFGYCTWYVFNLRPVPWLGNAIEWWSNARAYGYAEGYQPRVGAIMVSRDSWWGHVALVTSVQPDGSWWVTEMNWVSWNVVDSRHVYPGGSLVGFIL